MPEKTIGVYLANISYALKGIHINLFVEYYRTKYSFTLWM